MSKKEKTYLPKMRTNYSPIPSKLESSASDGQITENLPNPAADPIVANNIACNEFDYTQDMMSSDSFFLDDNDTKKF